VELEAVELALGALNAGHNGTGAGDGLKSGGYASFVQRIAVSEKHFLFCLQPGKERRGGIDLDGELAVLASVLLFNSALEDVVHQLHAVADTQDRRTIARRR
jgi:hypothetical protein